MSLVAAQNNNASNPGAVLEKVILGNDLSNLSSIEKVQYVKNICDSIGLNPMTRPIQLMKFQGKEVPYFSKDATEQLRKINKISITIKETKIIDDLYIVTVEAVTPDGRIDSSTGAITISGLKGDAKANALMKCETKAKRRVTLSICGLGFIDESEAESLPSAIKVNISNEPSLIVDNNYLSDIEKIESSKTLLELQTNFADITKRLQREKNLDAIKEVILAKDKRKEEIELVLEFNKEIENNNSGGDHE
jgi:hypothetical protein